MHIERFPPNDLVHGDRIGIPLVVCGRRIELHVRNGITGSRSLGVLEGYDLFSVPGLDVKRR